MDDMDVQDSLFVYLVGAHVVARVSLVVKPDAVNCCVRFLREDGQAGNVVTKRGRVKQFRLPTAIHFLRESGLTCADLQFGAVPPVQASIPDQDQPA
jgi:hypothetical protein